VSGAASFTASDAIDLLEWKHAIFALYAEIREAADPEHAWRDWRATRDRMYRDHPQSPIPIAARTDFAFCRFYDYDPAWRTVAVIENADPDPTEIVASTGGTFSFTRIGIALFTLHGREHELELTWNNGYGGGIFLAFTDETSGSSTYGGGRYLIDTVKGADLGFDRDAATAVLDFNFAFNPSCSYDARWACPLAPAANRLPIAVTAGEQHVIATGKAQT
jgi:uncharacterized protein (DUF1684 family)